MKTFNYTLHSKDINETIDFSYFINKRNILIQIFCGNSKENLQEIAEYLLDSLPQAICIGSSTDGEINDSQVSTKKTVISITIFENTNLQIESCSYENSYENGKYIANSYAMKIQNF